MDYNVSGRGRHRKIWRWDAHHYCAHLWMNIAKNIRNTRSIEMYTPARSTFVQTKIESLSVELREHIMKEGVKIRKVYDATNRYDE